MQMFWKAVGKAFVVNAGVWTAIYAFDLLHQHGAIDGGLCDCIVGSCFLLVGVFGGVEVMVILTNKEIRLATAINSYRVLRGLHPLQLDDLLMTVARERVGVFEHYHPDYGWIWDHLFERGFEGVSTDNVAQGYMTPEEAVGDATTGWGDESSRSVGHDMQMKGFRKIDGEWVDMKFDLLGVAVDDQQKNYCAIFARRFNGSQSTTESTG